MTTNLKEQLGEMQEEAFHQYLRTINTLPTEEHRQSILDVGMLAMARYELENPGDYISRFMGGPLWLPGVRTGLVSFIGQDPEGRYPLRGSIYFKNDRNTEIQIGRVVSASITPAGIYWGPELAEGIADGRVSAVPYRPRIK